MPGNHGKAIKLLCIAHSGRCLTLRGGRVFF
jgi:hypothetical protein